MGINPGHFATSICQLLDQARIKKFVRQSTDAAKTQRKKLRAIRKCYQDKTEEKEDSVYAKGSF